MYYWNKSVRLGKIQELINVPCMLIPYLRVYSIFIFPLLVTLVFKNFLGVRTFPSRFLCISESLSMSSSSYFFLFCCAQLNLASSSISDSGAIGKSDTHQNLTWWSFDRELVTKRGFSKSQIVFIFITFSPVCRSESKLWNFYQV